MGRRCNLTERRNFAPYRHSANIYGAYRDHRPCIYKSHLDYAWVGIPQSPPFQRTTTTADATSNTGTPSSTLPPPSPPRSSPQRPPPGAVISHGDPT